jgi:16S rRNA (guanine527-N7)-methyltransferase
VADAGLDELAQLQRRYHLPGGAADRLAALLEALAAEPDPPTTIADPRRALDQHVADSLSGLIAPELDRAGVVADIGSGAGFPGLALAVARPDARFDLLESAERKCTVIRRLAAAAGIDNVRALPVRAEGWAAGEGAGAYEAVTARAVAALPVLCEYAAPLLRVGGSLVAWKGRPDPAEERGGDEAADLLGLAAGRALPVTPFAGARDRRLYVYAKVGETPERFPRRPGVAMKRPLGG